MSRNVSKILNMKILSINTTLKVLSMSDFNYLFYILTNHTFDGYTSM